jgi:alkyldihydroxyacetonephosphate synthase
VLSRYPTEGLTELATHIQVDQQSNTLLSQYHIRCGAACLLVDTDSLTRALDTLGCNMWSTLSEESGPIEIPTDKTEQWTVFLQCSHLLVPLVCCRRPTWSKWLCHSVEDTPLDESLLDDSLLELSNALVREFDAADKCIEKSLLELRLRGFVDPTDEHVIQVAARLGQTLPLLLLSGALSQIRSRSRKEPESEARLTSRQSSLVGSRLSSDESLGFWGYADSFFVVHVDKTGKPVVSMRGGRYRDKSKLMKGLVTFVESETGVKIDPLHEAFKGIQSLEYSQVSESALSSAQLLKLREAVTKLSVDDSERLRHGTGHSIEDVFKIRNGDQIRAPDVVIWPESEAEVEAVIRAAVSENWCVIPFGGGTNVSHATRCPAYEDEPRPILSMDLSQLNAILWVDHENMLAHVQAGIRGGDLVEQMKRRGYTIGHEPDSIEFSTLGGWIATKASGMKRSKYGNIEEIVKGVHVVTPQGVLRHGDMDSSVWGRESTGLDLGSLMLGSEGCLGVVTSAVIRMWPLPETQAYEGIVLPDFASGFAFLQEVARLQEDVPASCRLLDNEHFRLGVALRPDSSSLIKTMEDLLRTIFFRKSGFKSDCVVCVTIKYESSRGQVSRQKRSLRRLASKHGGILLGSDAGKNGYDLTFLIAYLRDFALGFHLMGESFETFSPWSKALEIVDGVKKRICNEHAIRCLPGRPFVGCRVTQLYNEGVCLYFYVCMSWHNVPRPMEIFSEIENAARQEILDRGGSLSHHHGVGKLRSDFLPSINSTAFQSVQQKIKEALDPSNIFGARNGPYAERHT